MVHHLIEAPPPDTLPRLRNAGMNVMLGSDLFTPSIELDESVNFTQA